MYVVHGWVAVEYAQSLPRHQCKHVRLVPASLLIENNRADRYGKVASLQPLFNVDVDVFESPAFAREVLLAEVCLLRRDGAAWIHSHIDLNWSRRLAFEMDHSMNAGRSHGIDGRKFPGRLSFVWLP